MLSDSSPSRRWFELFVQVLVVYSIGTYYLESELTEAGYIAPGTLFSASDRYRHCIRSSVRLPTRSAH